MHQLVTWYGGTLGVRPLHRPNAPGCQTRVHGSGGTRARAYTPPECRLSNRAL